MMGGFYFVLFIGVCAFSCVSGEEDKQKCINDIVEWCNKQDYGPQVGQYLMSNTEKINGQSEHVQCTSAGNGTTCTRDGNFWYSCSADHTVTYRDSKLLKDTPDGGDDEICYTASRLHKPEEMRAAMKESAEKSRQNVKERIKEMKEKLGRKCFPFCGD